MKIFFDEDIKIVSKRVMSNEYIKFLKTHSVHTDGKRKIVQQKCIFRDDTGERMMAVLNEISNDFTVEIGLPEFFGDHLDIRIRST